MNNSKHINKIKSKIPPQAFSSLNLEKADESTLKKLSSLSFKCPKTTLIFSIFFGILGVDRFYKGDIRLGIVKFLLGFCVIIVLFNTVNSSFFDDYTDENYFTPLSIFSFAVAFLLFLSGCIWWLVDIFLVFIGVKKDNLTQLQATLLS